MTETETIESIISSLAETKFGDANFIHLETELINRYCDYQLENNTDPLQLHEITINLIRNRICNRTFIRSLPDKKWLQQLFRFCRVIFRDKTRIDTFHSLNMHLNYVQIFEFLTSRFLKNDCDWNGTIQHCLIVTQKLITNGDNAQKFVDCRLEERVLRLLETRAMTVLQRSLEILGRLSDWSVSCRENLCESNAIDVCLQLIPDGDILTQKLCVSLLRILSCEPQGTEQIRIWDGVKILLGLISINNSRLQWHVTWTLAHLAEQSETSTEIAQLGGISLIMAGITNPKPPEKALDDWISMLTGFTALLAQLCQLSSNQQIVTNANGVYILGKLLHIRKSVKTEMEERKKDWNDLQSTVFRVLRLLFPFDRARQMLKKVMPTEIYEKFVDIGNYNNQLEEYVEVARLYDQLIDMDADIIKEWESINERKHAIAEVGEFELLDQLGAGAFGCVYTVRKKTQSHTDSPAKLFALKEIFMTNLGDRESDKSFGDMINEVKIIKQQLRHPNIVRYRRIFVENHRLYIVMDLIQGSSLREHIVTRKEKKEPFEEKKIWFMVVQMMLALRYLHKEKQIVHRDLKPNNIMITDSDRVVITDFGLAKQKGAEYLKSAAGTIIYSCPEIVQNLPYGERADIWSFGCCVYEMCQLKAAFHSTNMLTLAMQIVESRYDPIDENWSDELRALITLCLTPDSSNRPDILNLSMVVGSRILEYLDDVARQQASATTTTESVTVSSSYSKYEDTSPNSLNSSTSSYKRPNRPSRNSTLSILPPINPAARRNHSLSAGDTSRYTMSTSLPRISDKYNTPYSPAASIQNRRRVKTCSSEHPARSSSSNDLKVPRLLDGVTVRMNALRPIQDPVLAILTQIHRILVVTDKELITSPTVNHQKRLMDIFRKKIMGKDSDAVEMKMHLRKLAMESPDEIDINLGFSDFRPVLAQAHLNGYQKDQKVTKITYEQLSGCIQNLLIEADRKPVFD